MTKNNAAEVSLIMYLSKAHRTKINIYKKNERFISLKLKSKLITAKCSFIPSHIYVCVTIITLNTLYFRSQKSNKLF